MKMSEMNVAETRQFKAAAEQAYATYKGRGLKLNMARGKPCREQLDLCASIHETLTEFDDGEGEDARNYNNLLGLKAARGLFGAILGMPPELVMVGGSSSLNLMYDTVGRAFTHGVLPGMTPWHKLERVKFLCPSPGYDRHFAVTESFGLENIAVPMTAEGPDMEVIERLVAEDASIKGMWCVPMYSNPDGIVYSDRVVRRLAALKPAAPDFRIFWDNAYAVHHLYPDEHEVLLNLYEECLKQNNGDLVYMFASTSKVTMASGGMAAMAMSQRNLEWAKKWLTIQTIGYDRVNQLRHLRYLPDLAAVEQVMRRHAAIIRPKFELTLDLLEREIAPLGIASWHRPRGGYFISFSAPQSTAKRIVTLCQEAGVVLTGAGATYPGGYDPYDSNIRIAPTFPPLSELRQAMEIFCLAVKIAAAEQALA